MGHLMRIGVTKGDRVVSWGHRSATQFSLPQWRLGHGTRFGVGGGESTDTSGFG